MKRVKNRRRAWILAWVLLPLAVLAQPATTDSGSHAFSLQQAVDYANKHNVQVKNALLDVQVQQQTNREVTGSAYPQISATGSLTYNYKLPVSLVPAEFIGGQPGTFQEFVFGVKWDATGGVSLNQLLFDGQVFTGLQARKTLIDFQEKNVEVTQEMIRTNIYKVYYQLAVSRTQIELLDANIDRIQKLQHDTKALFDNGFVEKLDIDKLDVQLTNLQTEKTNVLNQVSNGYLGLKVLIGMPVREELVLTDTLTDQMVKDDVLDPVGFSYDQRKDFQYADLGLRLRQYDVQRYKLAKLPTLSLSAYYNKNAQRNSFDFFKSDGNWFNISAVALRLNIPIFSGFSANARIAKARLALQQSQNQLEALKLNIDNEIQKSRNNYVSAISSLDFQKKNMALAENIYQQTKKKYESGLASQTDINTTQTDLKSAQTNYINALYNAVIAKVDFLKATGKL